MKRRFIAVLCFFAAMALLPALSVGNLIRPNLSSSPDEALSPQKNEVIAGAASLCEEDFCDEALRACLIIAHCNLAAGKKPGNNNSDKELKKRLAALYDSEKELYLTFENKVVAVPYLSRSNGKTFSNSSLPYLCPVASPWDCVESYDEALRCEGVSLNGLSFLCRNGMSAEEALLWYLPKLKLTEKRPE